MEKKKGIIVDVVAKKIYEGEVEFDKGIITSVKKNVTLMSKIIEGTNTLDYLSSVKNGDVFILPGFIDSHIHIESSMLSPSQFAKVAVKHGTVSTVSDPHEIANVLGIDGVKFMVEDGNRVPFKFFFGAPSCVPATSFETSGADLNAENLDKLISDFNLKYMSEMMNFPGVIYDDVEVMKKLGIAKKYGIPVDGHAPALSGENLEKYASAGITTDHESFTLDEAVEKIKLGIKLQIREGSAAKNFEALYKAIDLHPNDVMLCSDDLHPDDLLEGHISKLVVRAIEKGMDFFNVICACTVNPVKHYNLNVGLLQTGDPADFIVVDDIKTMNIIQTYINGELVFDKGEVLIKTENPAPLNKFEADFITVEDISVVNADKKINVIEAIEGELITKKLVVEPKVENNFIVSDTKNDILKIIVLNRYNKNSKPAVGFIKGFGLKKGAIASSIAHDSHNIIAMGTSDKEIILVVNRLIELKGGIVLSDEAGIFDLQLNIGGIMSNKSGIEVAEKYKFLNSKIKDLGCELKAPFMTLSFMALLVIPELKIGDKGLFDVLQFKPVSLFEN